jgi:hypothetical protein
MSIPFQSTLTSGFGLGSLVAGVIIIPEDLAIGLAIEELTVLIECCEMEELTNQVKYIPI